MSPKLKKSIFKRWWFWLIVIVVIIAIAGSSSSYTSKSTNDNNSKKITESSKKETPKTRDNSNAKETTLNTGTFTAGKDLPIGRYICTPTSGSGNFIVTENDIPVINEILGGTENLGTPSVTDDFKDGQKIQISGLKGVKFTPAETKLKTELTTGKWEVGLDIEPGNYVAGVKSGNGNFFVYRGGVPIVNEILGENDSLSVPNVTIDIKNGDIIQISGLTNVTFTKK